jgi:hypothetical protein
MYTRTITGIALYATALLLGCEQGRDPTPHGAAPTTAAEPPVASTPLTPSLPSAELALKSRSIDSDATRDSDATKESDATKDTALTRKERDEAMPLPGQANDHSNPEFAKRGDDKSSAKTTN